MAKFEPGHQKFGGRTKDSLNKKNQEIHDLAKELNCNPAKILMLIAMGDGHALGLHEHIDLDQRKDAAKDLMPYLYGKRKPIDSEGNDSSTALEDILSAIDGTK